MHVHLPSEDRERGDWLTRTERSRSEPREVIVNRGSLEWGSASIEYYTTQPAPAQWTAIAVVPLMPGEVDGTSRMLVGSGASEEAAVSALMQRLTRTTLMFDSAHEPSNWFGD